MNGLKKNLEKMGSPEDKAKRHRRRKNTLRERTKGSYEASTKLNLYKRKDHYGHTSQERLQKDHSPNEVYDRKTKRIKEYYND